MPFNNQFSGGRRYQLGSRPNQLPGAPPPRPIGAPPPRPQGPQGGQTPYQGGPAGGSGPIYGGYVPGGGGFLPNDPNDPRNQGLGGVPSYPPSGGAPPNPNPGPYPPGGGRPMAPPNPNPGNYPPLGGRIQYLGPPVQTGGGGRGGMQPTPGSRPGSVGGRPWPGPAQGGYVPGSMINPGVGNPGYEDYLRDLLPHTDPRSPYYTGPRFTGRATGPFMEDTDPVDPFDPFAGGGAAY